MITLPEFVCTFARKSMINRNGTGSADFHSDFLDPAWIPISFPIIDRLF
jgi:hypothetical protein